MPAAMRCVRTPSAYRQCSAVALRRLVRMVVLVNRVMEPVLVRQMSCLGAALSVMPPGRSRERVGEVLRLVRDEAAGEFHDAYRMGGLAVVGDHAFADPQIPSAPYPADGKAPVRRMAAAMRLDLCADAEALPGLTGVQDRP